MINWFEHLYPYTNVHELNLDWILGTVKAGESQIKNFIGANVIKYANPIAWDISRQYEGNTVVVDPGTGDAYISVKPVPLGYDLSHVEYWTKIFNYGGVVDTLMSQIATNEGNSPRATAARAVGDLVFINGVLYEVTQPIVQGQFYVVNTNVTHVTIEQLLHDETTARVNADNVLQGNIDAVSGKVTSVINSLASKGIVLGSVNVLRVSVAGTAPFMTLPDAITQAEAATEPTIIMLEPGTYDIPVLFPKASYPGGMYVPANTYIVGNGKRDDIILEATFVANENAYSPVNMRTNGGVFNMAIYGDHSRYCIHDDGSVNGEYTRVYENIRLHGHLLAYKWALGAGIRPGNTVHLNHVKFENDNACCYVRNWVGDVSPVHVIIENCDFFEYAAGDYPYDIVVNCQHEYAGVTTYGDFLVDIKTSNAKSVLFTTEEGNTNFAQVTCDNPYIYLNPGYDKTKAVKAGVVRCYTLQNLTKGTLVAFAANGNQANAFEQQYPRSFANGVTISDKDSTTNEVLVCTHGYVSGDDIGIAVQPSKYLIYDYQTGKLAVDDNPSVVTVAYGTAVNYWRLCL